MRILHLPEGRKQGSAGYESAHENAANRRALGTRYEEVAERYLVRHGLRIIGRNFRNRSGEIDLIACDGATVVFIEVKYRKTKSAGSANDAVDLKKQIRICRTADYYRMLHQISEFSPVRFDVIAVDATDNGELALSWTKNAFPYHSKSQ